MRGCLGWRVAPVPNTCRTGLAGEVSVVGGVVVVVEAGVVVEEEVEEGGVVEDGSEAPIRLEVLEVDLEGPRARRPSPRPLKTAVGVVSNSW